MSWLTSPSGIRTRSSVVEDLTSQEQPKEINLRTAFPLLAYLNDTLGEDVRDEVLTAAGLLTSVSELEECWVSHAEYEALLAAGRRRLKSDEEFSTACQYQIGNQYGPLVLVLRLTSLRAIVRTLDRTRHLVTRIGRFESESLAGPNSVRIRYRSTKADSRLFCLLRRAQWATIPSVLWGLSPAIVTERKCIAKGDDCCECDVRWQEPFRWRLPTLGVVAGGAVGLALWLVTGLLWLAPWPAVLGLVLGWYRSMLKVNRAMEAFQEANSKEAEKFVVRHLESTRELLRLHQRQEVWTTRVERESLQSSHALGAVLGRLQSLTLDDPTAARDISHDLRNPLTLVRASANLLANGIREGVDHAQLDRFASHLNTGVERLNEMLDDVMRIAGTQIQPVEQDAPVKVITTDSMPDRYRRQLQALTVDRDLQISVELTRETPAQLETRPSILERVVDNLLTNAAKYTDRGRIHVEISGVPGFLCIKVADTGRGIRPNRLEAVLTGLEVDDAPAVGESRGLGLSVVVRHLNRLGGRLEVLSRPDMGTTFWVYVPTQPPENPYPDGAAEPIERMLRRVVTIRVDSAEHPAALH